MCRDRVTHWRRAWPPAQVHAPAASTPPFGSVGPRSGTGPHRPAKSLMKAYESWASSSISATRRCPTPTRKTRSSSRRTRAWATCCVCSRRRVRVARWSPRTVNCSASSPSATPSGWWPMGTTWACRFRRLWPSVLWASPQTPAFEKRSRRWPRAATATCRWSTPPGPPAAWSRCTGSSTSWSTTSRPPFTTSPRGRTPPPPSARAHSECRAASAVMHIGFAAIHNAKGSTRTKRPPRTSDCRPHRFRSWPHNRIVSSSRRGPGTPVGSGNPLTNHNTSNEGRLNRPQRKWQPRPPRNPSRPLNRQPSGSAETPATACSSPVRSSPMRRRCWATTWRPSPTSPPRSGLPAAPRRAWAGSRSTSPAARSSRRGTRSTPSWPWTPPHWSPTSATSATTASCWSTKTPSKRRAWSRPVTRSAPSKTAASTSTSSTRSRWPS